MASIMKSSSITARTSVARRSGSVRPLRATPEDKPAFKGAQAYTEEQKLKADAAPAKPIPSSPPAPSASVISVSDVMAFSGAAPEITNGRLAMLGFVSAVAAELSSGESVLRQWSDQPTLINLTFILFISASLVPLFNAKKSDKQIGPFTPSAELLNGRAAMIGFAALLAYEAVKGQALF